MVMVYIASFEAISELQRKRLLQSCVTSFSWIGRTRGQFLQVKSWVPWSLLHHCLHTSVVSSRHPLYGRSWRASQRVSVTEQTNTQKSDFWGNSACANSVYPALFSLPTHESLGTRLEWVMQRDHILSFNLPIIYYQEFITTFWSCIPTFASWHSLSSSASNRDATADYLIIHVDMYTEQHTW